MKRHRDPVRSFALHLPSGAAFGAITAEKCAYIEAESGLRLVDLFDIFLCQSVGAITGSVAVSPGRTASKSPVMAMSEFVPMFQRHLPLFLPKQRYHYWRHIAHGLIRDNLHPAVNQAIGLGKLHYDAGVMERVLIDNLGHVNLDHQSPYKPLKTIHISTQSIDPILANFDFVHVEPDLLENADRDLDKLTHPQTAIPLYKAVMAAAAFPTVFPTYHIAETDTHHIDCGQIDTPVINFMLTLRHHLRRDRQLACVRLGTGDDRRRIHAAAYNKMTARDLLSSRLIFRSAALQAQDSTGLIMKNLLGEDAYFNFDHRIYAPNGQPGQGYPSDDLLDTSAGQISLMAEFARRSIHDNREHYDRMIDMLVENHARATICEAPGYSLRQSVEIPARAALSPHGNMAVKVSFGEAATVSRTPDPVTTEPGTFNVRSLHGSPGKTSSTHPNSIRPLRVS